jgi:hypothetical protein
LPPSQNEFVPLFLDVRTLQSVFPNVSSPRIKYQRRIPLSR